MLGIFVLAASLMMIIHSVRSFRPTALVTGSTDGIGVTTGKHLAAKGYNVLVHGRDEKRIEAACNKIRKFVHDSPGDGDGVLIESLGRADLSTVRGCEKLAQNVKKLCQEKQLHLMVLMNNAGVYAEELVTTTDGTELTFAVNVVAPFVLTSHLLPELLQASRSSKESSRIVIASSISQCRKIRDWDDLNYDNAKRSYSAHGAYSESKLLDAMLSNEIAERLQVAGHRPNQITCNSLDPGTVNTKMLLAGWGPCGIDVEDALDQTYVCSSSDMDGVSGEYFTQRSKTGKNYKASERAKLWNILSDLAPSAAEMWKFDWE